MERFIRGDPDMLGGEGYDCRDRPYALIAPVHLPVANTEEMLDPQII
jgi:hypothetical protein